MSVISQTIASVIAAPDDYDESWMSYISIGSGASEGTSAIETELHRKEADILAIKNTYFARANFGLDEPDSAGEDISEIALYDESSGGNCAYRWLLDTAMNKLEDEELQVEIFVTIVHGE